MHIITIRKTLFCLLTLTLFSCSGFFDKDNTPPPSPLVSFQPALQPVINFSTRIGSSSDDYLKMNPTLAGNSIYVTSSRGIVSAIDKFNGRIRWQFATGVTTFTGPGAGNGLVVIGSNKGEVIALSQSDGHILWKAAIAGEILAKPAVGANIVVIKTIDGYVRGLSTINGQIKWIFRQLEPNLILREASAPVIQYPSLLAGFANGNLVKLGINDGQLLWMQTIAVPQGSFPVQRMIDIDATPVIYHHGIYVATYQGKIAALDWTSGKLRWSHDISSYTGMSVDSSSVYITDAKGHVWSLGADSGLVNWRQTQLTYRTLSAPALMGNYVIIGDAEGYLHWLNKVDGRFNARVMVGSAIYATPIVEGNRVYVLTQDGHLNAYTAG